MPTQQPRLNLTLDAPMMQMIAKLAKKGHQSRALVAKNLIAQALELQEDLYFSTLANAREKDNSPWVSHEEIWK